MAKYSPRKMREDLLNDDDFPPARLNFMISEALPFSHAGTAAEIKRSATAIREHLEQHGGENPAPLHEELDKSMSTAASAADLAFEMALLAAWQYYWLLEKCTCASCRLRKQRENADLQ